MGTGRWGSNWGSSNDSYRDLMAAVLLQAFSDLRRGPRVAAAAREFLLGPDGAWYATALGIDLGAMRAAVGGQHGRRNDKAMELQALR